MGVVLHFLCKYAVSHTVVVHMCTHTPCHLDHQSFLSLTRDFPQCSLQFHLPALKFQFLHFTALQNQSTSHFFITAARSGPVVNLHLQFLHSTLCASCPVTAPQNTHTFTALVLVKYLLLLFLFAFPIRFLSLIPIVLHNFLNTITHQLSLELMTLRLIGKF